MKQMERGERLPLAQAVPDGVLQAGLSAQGLALDFACFGLDAGVGHDGAGFRFRLASLPAWVERLSIVASTAMTSRTASAASARRRSRPRRRCT